MFEEFVWKDWYYLAIFVLAILLLMGLFYGIKWVWLKIRPPVLTPPYYWPKKNKYLEAKKRFKDIIEWPTIALGTTGDAVIIPLLFFSMIFMPLMLIIAIPIWLFDGIPNHWLWWNISQKKSR